VNEVKRGGWLEFLTRVEFDKNDFDMDEEAKRSVKGGGGLPLLSGRLWDSPRPFGVAREEDRHGSNVLILTDQNSWVIGRALGKPEKLAQVITNHDNERIPAGQKVVRVYQYEVLKEARDPLKHTYCLRTNEPRTNEPEQLGCT
jgi:hypothetical protein